jgi:branched-chain amino acid transport system substrate-binding protein
MVFDQMSKQKQTKLAIAAVANAYGQTFVDVAQKMAGAAGISVVSVERFAATDTSFVAQTVKLMGQSPDAVLIAAAGTSAALPHLELKKRGFTGTIFQTQAVANNDFLRIGGKDVDGALLPVSPLLVAEQLPDSNPVKPVALAYVNKFEGQYGAGSRSLFGAMAWDAMAMIEVATPAALKKAQPGTAEFRKALRDSIESAKDLVLTQGVYSMSPTDHNGADRRSQVLVRIDGGKWRYMD